MFTLRTLIVLIVLVICTVSDIRTKEINLIVPAAGIFIMFCSGKSLYFEGIIPGFVFLILSKLNIGIGDGDAYIFIFIGLILGLNKSISILVVSFVTAGGYALMMKVYKRMEACSTFAFAPFILLGFVFSSISSMGVVI